MNIEFELKEYLDKRFDSIDRRLDSIDRRLEKIDTELKEHRETENEIKIEIGNLKNNFRWLIAILSPIATALLIGVTKITFFS